jgi:hypothetical protein
VALEWQQANQNFVIAAWEGEYRDDTECHGEEFCVEVSPGQDLQAAIAANPAGTSFLIKAGIHRMTGAVIPKNNNTFSGEPGAILNGSQVITNFVKSGATWVASGMTMENPVATGDCLSSIIPADEQADVNGVPFDPSASKACTFPNDVYYDHAVLKRVMRADLVVPGTFYFDLARDQIYIGDNPVGHTVEVGVATQAFKGHNTGVEGVIIRGLIVEKFATETGIAAINGRVGWTIENCEVRLNHAVGIQGQFVRNNKIHHNGQFGVSGGGLDSIFEGNEIAYNNYAGYSRGTSGGSKFVYATNLILRNNHVHHNNGPGLWTDGDNVDTIYEGNRVEYNATAGIFHEIGYDAVIRNNVVRHNNASQLGKSLWWGANIFLNASQNVEVYGNTIEGRHGLGIVDTGKRGAGKLGARHAQHNNVHDNVFKLTAGERVGTEGVAGEASKKNRFVNNIYYLTDLAGPYFNGLTKEGWVALGQDVTGTFILWK